MKQENDEPKDDHLETAQNLSMKMVSISVRAS